MNGYDAVSLFHLDSGTSTDGRSIGGKKRQPMMPHRVTLSCSEGSVGAGLRDASLRLRVRMLSCCRFILFTARNRAAPPSPASDHEDHPYGSPSLAPVFMASVDAYEADQSAVGA